MKESFYFSHDYNARNDNKIKKLIAKLGYEAYGIYWALIEELYNNENRLDLDYEVLSFSLRVDEDKLKTIINDFELFVVKENYFYSKSAEKRIAEREKKRKTAKRNAGKRWANNKTEEVDESGNDADEDKPQSENNANAMQEQCKNDATALQPHNDCNAIKERKGKDKERKENKKKIELKNPNDSQFVIDYIQNNLPNVGKMKRPLTLEEADKLVTDFSKQKVIEKLESMENKKTLNKDYAWTYTTCKNWLKREFGDRMPPNERNGTRFTKGGIPIPQDDRMREVI